MFGSILAANAAALALLLGTLWLISLLKRDASIVDPFWGAGFVVVAWISWLLGGQPTGRSLAIVLLVTLWGLRLSGFLLWRNWGHGEDYRYRAMRQYHGERFWWVSLFSVFALQGVILWFVALPIQAGIGFPKTLALSWPLDILGGVLISVGIFFEAVGDWQLASFKANPANAGRVFDRGLWRYTRHPNYFGDFCVWWGFYCLSAAQGAWWTVLSPLAMSFLLLKVSGVALLESTIVDRRPEYASYQRRTSAFFPRLPRE
jgi:steroid 5-alpha reductase family enzyme